VKRSGSLELTQQKERNYSVIQATSPKLDGVNTTLECLIESTLEITQQKKREYVIEAINPKLGGVITTLERLMEMIANLENAQVTATNDK